jgi:release factor glutamine methyltransferase
MKPQLGVAPQIVARVLQLLHRRTHKNEVTALDGIRVQLCPHVFNPIIGRTTEFFLRHMKIRSSTEILEIGTGTGIIAAKAALQAAHVVATDINTYAIECAKRTLELNGIRNRVEVLQGDLFEPVQSRQFDFILFNPPYLALPVTNHLSHSWNAGPNCELIFRFLTELPQHLAPNANAQILLSSVAPMSELISMMKRCGFKIRLMAKGKLLYFVETLYLLMLCL